MTLLRKRSITNRSNTHAASYLLHGEMRHGEHPSTSRELHLPGGTKQGCCLSRRAPANPRPRRGSSVPAGSSQSTRCSSRMSRWVIAGMASRTSVGRPMSDCATRDRRRHLPPDARAVGASWILLAAIGVVIFLVGVTLGRVSRAHHHRPGDHDRDRHRGGGPRARGAAAAGGAGRFVQRRPLPGRDRHRGRQLSHRRRQELLLGAAEQPQRRLHRHHRQRRADRPDHGAGARVRQGVQRARRLHLDRGSASSYGGAPKLAAAGTSTSPASGHDERRPGPRARRRCRSCAGSR